jgi:ferredoxin
MVTYDRSKCEKCGSCIKTCHEYCITMNDDGIIIDYSLCSTCTQCIAICRTHSLNWNDIKSEEIDKSLLPDSMQIAEFLKSRRSDRYFRKDRIDRDILNKIAVMGKYSPTNNYGIDVIIIDDVNVIRLIMNECLEKTKKLYNLVFKPVFMQRLGNFLSPEYEKAKIKFEKKIESRQVLQDAPVLVVLFADPRIRLTELSAQFFLYNMQLFAKTLGIGSRESYGGKMFVSNSKKVIKMLGIPKDKKIQGFLFLGYPEFEFVNKVEGISPNIYFNKVE